MSRIFYTFFVLFCLLPFVVRGQKKETSEVGKLFGAEAARLLEKNDIDGFSTLVYQKTNLSVEAVMQAMMLRMDAEKKAGQEAITPENWRWLYTASYEYSLYTAMGGTNGKGNGQALGALLLGGVGESFRPLIIKNPDVFSVQIDSVAAYLKRLDYMGTIYPEEKTLKTHEQQDSIVGQLIVALERLRESSYALSASTNVVCRMLSELYKNQSIDNLSDYFTEEACKQITDKSFDLATITPPSTWKEWDAYNPNLYSMLPMGHNMMWFLLKSKKDAINSPGQDEQTRSFYYSVQKVEGEWKISCLMRREEYINKYAPYLNGAVKQEQ